MADVDTPQELDLELVRRVQHGESAAFDVLVRKYQHRVVALVGRYIADWSECQDGPGHFHPRLSRDRKFPWRRPVLNLVASNRREYRQKLPGFTQSTATDR